MSDYAGMRDYLHQRRLAFICSKDLSLESLASERRPPVPWWMTAASVAARGTKRR
jgi:hypothetical protein